MAGLWVVIMTLGCHLVLAVTALLIPPPQDGPLTKEVWAIPRVIERTIILVTIFPYHRRIRVGRMLEWPMDL